MVPTSAAPDRGPAPALAGVALAVALASPAAAVTQDELAGLSLEELADVRVTSVSRRARSLSDAAASVYVISAEDIRRAGARRLPEALRLAPNLQVARVNASAYAISARGFNNALGNKLLVLVDGRTVYTPLFSGVFWDLQDVMLEDVDRIEVISGPGGTLWGANAVNGVINIITRSAADTQGGRLTASGGDPGADGAVRYGGRLGSGYFRVYARRFSTDDSETAAGAALTDGWTQSQAGFRAEWGDETEDRLTVIGNGYRGESSAQLFGPVEASGENLLLRWRQRSEDGAELRLQAYYDASERSDPFQFHDRMRIADVEFQHVLPVRAHALIWGAGYRQARDEVRPGLIAAFLPARRTLRWHHLFVQDEVALGERLELTAGLKYEHNDYTGGEWLPSLRLAWKAGEDALVWGSLSRAVRTPSRIDREFFLPAVPPYLIAGGPDFESEVARVAELGLRHQPWGRFHYSLTAFHHDYDRLRSGQPTPAGNFQVVNGIEGRTHGLEAWATLQATEGWRLSAGAVWLRKDLRLKPWSLDPDGTTAQGNDPDHQWQLRSSVDITPRLEFDLSVRGVDDLPAPAIPGYISVDLGVGWRPHDDLALRLQVSDLFNHGHTEFAPGLLSAPTEFRRSVWLSADWRW